MTGARVAADIGGTFTDIALRLPDGRLLTRKVPSTPHDYAEAVVAGVCAVLDESGIARDGVDEVLHATTVATNAILEKKGARTALITTKGFRDVLEMRRIRTPSLYEPLYVKPAPLVPRRLRFEVAERLAADGSVLTPLSEAELRAAIAEIERQEAEAVAVCFLHAYANPVHERQAGAMLTAALPDRFISLSCDVLPEIREYERTSTTVINAYLGPPVRSYLRSLAERLEEAGIDARLMVMQSGGGILSVRAVLDLPAQIVECGPAAGVIGAALIGKRTGHRDLITFDMGGTTAKASLVEGGRVLEADEYEVGGGVNHASRLAMGGGYALKLPVIDVAEVGAGGGSIVWLDKAGAIKVGPQSAGAVPGPACYDIGGEQATVTDANVVLGFLSQEALLGGAAPIDAEKARQAVRHQIARPLGRDLRETAYGIHTVANASMMRALKAVTTFRGRDPREFVLYAFGGGGGVHAAELARALQIGRVVLPPAAGVFSAVGLLAARVELSLSQALLQIAGDIDPVRLETLYQDLEERVAGQLDHQRSRLSFSRMMDMRYRGQAHELTIAMSDERPSGVAAIRAAEARFEEAHAQTYGHALLGDYACEVVKVRVVGSVTTDAEPIVEAGPDLSILAEPQADREAYFGPDIGTCTTAVIARAALSETPAPGPLIVEEYDSTAVVPPGCSVGLDGSGSLIIDVGDQP